MCVLVAVMDRRLGCTVPQAPCDGGTSAPSPPPKRKRTDLCVGGAGWCVCTYINVICINVIGALFPLQGLQPDTGVIIWKRGREEETSVELIILTRASGEEKGERDRETDSKKE